MNRLIYTSYSPNTRKKDLVANLAIYMSPRRWKEGAHSKKIELWFEKMYGNGASYFSYNYARSAMYHFFKALEPKRGDQIIFQGFTCIAAVNPAVWAGFKPVYADIDRKTLCFDLNSLAEKISSKTRVIVLQHTMGMTGNISEIVKLAKKHKIVLLEDCTHTILGRYEDRLLGTFGDAAVFSFGRDKAVTGVDGGVLMVNNQNMIDEIDKFYMDLDYPTRWWVWKQLNFPIFWAKFKFFYRFSPKLSKFFHLIATTLGLVTRATTAEEKSGTLPNSIPKLLPEAMARLAYTQLVDIESINKHRLLISKLYEHRLRKSDYVEIFEMTDDMPPIRFPALAYKRDMLLQFLAAKHIYLGDWFSDPISPADANPQAVGYKQGECPEGEAVGDRIVNLPTHVNITVEDANYIIDRIEEYYGIKDNKL